MKNKIEFLIHKINVKHFQNRHYFWRGRKPCPVVR